MSSSSEDECDELSWETWPPLTLYEHEESRYRAYMIKSKPKTRQEDIDSRGPYPIRRFLESVQGFYTGSLDLSGRHKPRYDSLLKQWNKFLSDFLTLAISVNRSETTEESGLLDGPGTTSTLVEYETLDFQLWSKFWLRWNVPTSWGFRFLMNLTQETLQVLGRHGSPRLQQICLLDLPNEVLHHIFSLGSALPISQIRLLSATCQRLRNVGLDYVFSTRLLALGVDHLVKWRELSRDNPKPALLSAIVTARKRVVEASAFLLHRPDLTERMKSIAVGGHETLLRVEAMWSLVFSTPAESYKFFKPAIYGATKVISSSHNLTEVAVSLLQLNKAFFDVITQLKSLNTLDIRSCILSSALLSEDTQQLLYRTLPQKLKLSISPSNGEEDNQLWPVVSFCQRLVNLNYSCPLGDMEGPPDHIIQRPKIFSSMRRLSIVGIAWWDVDGVANWIKTAKLNFPLLLTHFKLHSTWGSPDGDIFLLIDALSGAPLENLVLEGLADAELELFDRISSTFPDLLSLTLIRRQNSRHKSETPVRWPHASWEYAQRFGSFTRLRHFGWNFYTPGFEASTWMLLAMECNFDRHDWDVNVVSWPRSWMEMDDLSYIDDREYVAKSFAAYCPSLVVLSSGGHRKTMVYINRGNSGEILVDLEEYGGRNLDFWNPETLLGSGWPGT